MKIVVFSENLAYFRMASVIAQSLEKIIIL